MKSSRMAALCVALLLGVCAPVTAGVVITPEPGFTVSWNGNDGDLAAEGVPDNLALAANGGVPFSSGDLGPELGIGFHVAANINDGLYGNSNSWIGGDAFTPPAQVGVDLGGSREFSAVAWGRDNLAMFGDRSLGVYALEITQDASPGVASNWSTVATFDYQSDDDAVPGGAFSSALRHEYVVSTAGGDPLTATGVRLVVPGSGIGGGTAVDELEVLAMPISGPPPPPPPAVEIVPAAGFSATWNGNDGDHFDPEPPPDGARVPANLTSSGTAFSSGDLGPELGIGFHIAQNVNDGFYGNSNSWIGGDAGMAPFHAGVAFGRTVEIARVAWSRDNGNGAIDGSEAGTDACGGQCTDRSLGTYVLQVTLDENPGPASAWTDVASITYVRSTNDGPGGEFTSYLRHEFDVSEGGMPIAATGIRLLVPANGLGLGTAIDELEAYGPALEAPVNALPLALLLPIAGVWLLRKRRAAAAT